MTRQEARLWDCTRVAGVCERVHQRASIAWNVGRLELAMVHPPSDRFVPSPEAGSAARVAELKRAIESSPRPQLVVGDMNCRPGTSPYRFMVEARYADTLPPCASVIRSPKAISYQLE